MLQEFAAGQKAYKDALRAQEQARVAKRAAAATYRTAAEAHDKAKSARRRLDRLRCLDCLLLAEANVDPPHFWSRDKWCSSCSRTFCDTCWDQFDSCCDRCEPCCLDKHDVDADDEWLR